MRLVAYREYEPEKLKLSGSFRAKLTDPETEALAQNLEEVGLIHEPLVRQGTGEVISGESRVAAHMKLGTAVRCKVVECTDEEVTKIRESENLYRRAYDASQRKAMAERLIERRTEEIAKETGVRRRGKGKGKSAESLAREEAAKKEGVLPETLRVRQWRDEKRKEKQSAQPAEKINRVGMDIEEEFLGSLGELGALFEEMGHRLGQCNAMLTRAEKEGLPLQTSKRQKLAEQLSELTTVVNGCVPVSICPACKGIAQVQKQCAACETSGYVSKHQERLVPPKFWATENPVVLYQGKEVAVSSFFDKAVEAEEEEASLW